ncbi:MAG TPA: RNA-binding cell elongation regulator Jag/EloR [Ktedonobacteraceae bacterium]|nr:RNA-binding cell elongation regulator Jag/EloR [Ktedonobacteraceae bacterium]
MESIEASGKSVEEAIQQALMRLGKRRNEVDISVLQEPSRGLVGLGSRDARVRVTVRPTTSGTLSTNNAVITPEMADAILGPDVPDLPLPDDDQYEEDEFDEEGEEYIEDEEGEFEEEIAVPFNVPPLQEAFDASTVSTTQEEVTEVETPTREDVEITVDILQHILRYMNLRASVQVRSTHPLTLNIQGINENLGLLIGRRGETLAALQLLVGLIFGHRTKRRIRIVIDAENYRERREANLRSLALRVAQQVRNYRRSIALEAMPPHERRIVHLALSDSKDISTESIGEGEERRVVISLKRPGR